MWLWIDVYEKDVAQVRAGQPVSFTVSGTNSASEEATFTGRITWVGTEVDHTTRTTKVRAELPNPDGRLRANQFGRATIQIGDRHKAVTVAKSAVQRYENADLVFLPQTGERVPAAADQDDAQRPGGHLGSDVGTQARSGSRDHRSLPAEDGNHEGLHRGRMLRLIASSHEEPPDAQRPH